MLRRNNKIKNRHNSKVEMMKNYEKTVLYAKNEINKYQKISPIILFLKRYVKNLNIINFSKEV
jgi:hypothetical protein